MPAIPRTWEDEAVDSAELPLIIESSSPVYVRSQYYYSIPERPIYETYPVYAPGKEPPGYMEGLINQEPVVVFDASKLKTEEDWIKAGETVFDMPVFIQPITDVGNPVWYEKTGMPIAKDGTIPFARYVVRRKGKVELGIGHVQPVTAAFSRMALSSKGRRVTCLLIACSPSASARASE